MPRFGNGDHGSYEQWCREDTRAREESLQGINRHGPGALFPREIMGRSVIRCGREMSPRARTYTWTFTMCIKSGEVLTHHRFRCLAYDRPGVRFATRKDII